MKGSIRSLVLRVLMAALGLAASTFAAAQSTPMLYVTNSGGNDVTVINLQSMKAVGDIVVGAKDHGLCAPADGRTLFVTVESTRTLKIVDTATNKIIGSIQLVSHPDIARPNECASTPNGHYVAVPMRVYGPEQPKLGDMDVIDIPQRKIVKVIPMRFPHNCFAAGSNEFLYCESRALGVVYRLNLKTMSFDEKFPTGPDPRPFAIATKTHTMYAALGGFHGFAVVNMQTKKVERVPLPPAPPEPAMCQKYEPNTPTHGLALTPDGKELWVTSMGNASVYVYDVATKTVSQPIHTGDCPNWISITPDGKYVTVSNCAQNTTSVIDTQTKKVVADIKVGDVPKRLLAVNVPTS